MTFCLLVESKKMLAVTKTVMTQEGALFWVINEPEGWVPATSTQCMDRNKVPADVKTFDTIKKASAFAKSWKGHPWWCSPNGNFEVIEVVIVMKSVFSHYAPKEG